MVGNAHKHWVVPFLTEWNGPAYERCRSICLDGTNPQLDGYLMASHNTVNRRLQEEIVQNHMARGHEKFLFSERQEGACFEAAWRKL